VVERLGGLHAFMRWNGPMLTDSGGFQVFSLDNLRQVTPEGVTFASHLDGAAVFLNPEIVVEMQERLGADLIMPLDLCLGSAASMTEAADALELTLAWWRRSLRARARGDQALFALIQGGIFADLRREAVRAVASDDPPGYAIGGLSVGEDKATTATVLETTIAELPAAKPRYLMGVGHPLDLVHYARLGVDLFDCVLPTRLARNGAVWSDLDGTRLDLTRRELLGRSGAIMPDCACPACTCWPLGALAALYQARAPLAYRLASMHNLTLLNRLLRAMRETVVYTG
jgi:queuine tRNA-ribosyltransferase